MRKGFAYLRTQYTSGLHLQESCWMLTLLAFVKPLAFAPFSPLAFTFSTLPYDFFFSPLPYTKGNEWKKKKICDLFISIYLFFLYHSPLVTLHY